MYVRTPAGLHIITGGSTNLPHPGIPRQGPTPEQPPFVIMQPPPGIDKLIDTHILKGAIRELAIPLVLNLCDLSRRLVVEDVDLAVDGLGVCGLRRHRHGLLQHANSRSHVFSL